MAEQFIRLTLTRAQLAAVTDVVDHDDDAITLAGSTNGQPLDVRVSAAPDDEDAPVPVDDAVTDRDVVDAIATLYGTSAEWDADLEMRVVHLIAKVRPYPGSTTAAQYRERFLAATGRPAPEEWDANDGNND